MDSLEIPQRSPSRRGAGITQAQKQALIDNLQLEITERARKLRAQYALQAQGLRMRLEMRVNRIPQALRKRNMQDLMDEYTERVNPKPSAPLPAASTVKRVSTSKGKRKSDQISADENADPEQIETLELPNPKKRSKTTAPAKSKAVRTTSRQQQPSTTIAQPAAGGVLSPRSANSRTLPRSPIKPTGIPSPEKPAAASRLATGAQTSKPTTTTASSKPSSRQTSRQQKPSATAPTKASKAKKGATVGADKENAYLSDGPNSLRESEASNTSARTTIVKRGKATAATTTTKKSAPAKTAATGPPRPATAMAKRAPAAKAAPVARPATAASGRTLRKRA